jgi:hypothetical protein
MKTKKMADGGPTYPFYNNQPVQNTTAPSVVQKFVSPTPMMPAPGQNLIGNPMQNQGMNQQNPQGMKKGGRVGMKDGGMTEKKPHAAYTAAKNDPKPDDKAMEEMRKVAEEARLQKLLDAGHKGSTGGNSMVAPNDFRKLLGESSPKKRAKGGTVKMAKGGSASSRADGIAQRGKTKGRLV